MMHGQQNVKFYVRVATKATDYLPRYRDRLCDWRGW